ncbi:MAG: NlpC/P60 family protein [Cellulosilyticaceae bacterium]
MQFKKRLIMVAVGIATLIVPSLAFGKAYGSVNAGTLNARKGASTDTAIVTQLDERDGIEIVNIEKNGWFKIAVGEDGRAYVKSEFVKVQRAVANVTVNGLNVRDYPSEKGSKIIGKFYEGDEVAVHYKVGDWYNISQEGFQGFVHKDYIQSEYLKYLPTKVIGQVKKITQTQQAVNSVTKPKKAKLKSNNTVSEPKKASSLGSQVVSDAKQFLGNPYVYGGNSLSSGVDCSGFVQQIFKRQGIYLTRSSASQYSSDGYAVATGDLQPGDLLFYGYNGRVSHVSIYIGDGQVIHAQDERTDICISGAFNNGKPFIGAKRVL